MRRLLSLLLAVTASCGGSDAKTVAQPISPCRETAFEGALFIVCDPGKGDLGLFVAGKNEQPIRRFADLPVDPANVAFAMNAGMFDEAGRPIGLAVNEDGLKHAINLRDGGGNFHLKPNGVLIVTQGASMILPSDRAAAIAFRAAPRLQTQSGPMLVIDGKVHPKLAPDGTSRYVRNGVGVTSAGHPLFVISVDAVSLGKFARFFRDGLKTPNALYFDGSVSSLWDPANGRQDDFTELGPIIVAFRSGAGSAPGREARDTP
jgi:uncharacterized protein YigE (DUF2233 family)